MNSSLMSPTQRLRYHAGLESGMEWPVPSLSEALWQGTPLQQSLEDVFDALEALNRELNGPVPSESASRHPSFPRELIYAVTEIIRMIRRAPRPRDSAVPADETGRIARRLEMAWSAILAGDIDDLAEHVAQEEANE